MNPANQSQTFEVEIPHGYSNDLSVLSLFPQYQLKVPVNKILKLKADGEKIGFMLLPASPTGKKWIAPCKPLLEFKYKSERVLKTNTTEYVLVVLAEQPTRSAVTVHCEGGLLMQPLDGPQTVLSGEWVDGTSTCTSDLTFSNLLRAPQYDVSFEGPGAVQLQVRRLLPVDAHDAHADPLQLYVLPAAILAGQKLLSAYKMSSLIRHSSSGSDRSTSLSIQVDAHDLHLRVVVLKHLSSPGQFCLEVAASPSAGRLAIEPVAADFRWLQGEWTPDLSGGSLFDYKLNSWRQNPMFELQPSHAGVVTILLRKDSSSSSSSSDEEVEIGLAVLTQPKGGGRALLRESNLDTGVLSSYSKSALVARVSVDPSLAPLVVVPMTKSPGCLGRFEIGIPAEAGVLTPLPNVAPLRFEGLLGKGGCVRHSDWRNGPQFRVQALQATRLTAVLRVEKPPAGEGVGICLFRDSELGDSAYSLQDHWTHSPFYGASSTGVEIELDAHQSVIVAPMSFNPGFSCSFLLELYALHSSADIVAQPCPPWNARPHEKLLELQAYPDEDHVSLLPRWSQQPRLIIAPSESEVVVNLLLMRDASLSDLSPAKKPVRVGLLSYDRGQLQCSQEQVELADKFALAVEVSYQIRFPPSDSPSALVVLGTPEPRTVRLLATTARLPSPSSALMYVDRRPLSLVEMLSDRATIPWRRIGVSVVECDRCSVLNVEAPTLSDEDIDQLVLHSLRTAVDSGVFLTSSSSHLAQDESSELTATIPDSAPPAPPPPPPPPPPPAPSTGFTHGNISGKKEKPLTDQQSNSPGSGRLGGGLNLVNVAELAAKKAEEKAKRMEEYRKMLTNDGLEPDSPEFDAKLEEMIRQTNTKVVNSKAIEVPQELNTAELAVLAAQKRREREDRYREELERDGLQPGTPEYEQALLNLKKQTSNVTVADPTTNETPHQNPLTGVQRAVKFQENEEYAKKRALGLTDEPPIQPKEPTVNAKNMKSAMLLYNHDMDTYRRAMFQWEIRNKKLRRGEDKPKRSAEVTSGGPQKTVNTKAKNAEEQYSAANADVAQTPIIELQPSSGDKSDESKE